MESEIVGTALESRGPFLLHRPCAGPVLPAHDYPMDPGAICAEECKRDLFSEWSQTGQTHSPPPTAVLRPSTIATRQIVVYARCSRWVSADFCCFYCTREQTHCKRCGGCTKRRSPRIPGRFRGSGFLPR